MTHIVYKRGTVTLCNMIIGDAEYNYNTNVKYCPTCYNILVMKTFHKKLLKNVFGLPSGYFAVDVLD